MSFACSVLFSGLKRETFPSLGVEGMKKIVFAARIEKLPVDLQTALIGDLNATIEERLAYFERVAQRRRENGQSTN